MWHVYNTALRHANGFDTQEWLIVFAITVGLGVFLLRGFGSRKNY